MTRETLEPWVDSQAVADHIGKSVYTVRRRAQAGEFPGIKDGREWMFQLSAIDAHLNSKIVDPWAQSPRSRGRRRIT